MQLSEVLTAYSQFCRDLRPSEIEKLGIDAKLLHYNERRRLFKVKAARIVWVSNRFEFGECPESVGATIFVARDDSLDVADLVAWAPADGRLAAWIGSVAMLGQENVTLPRIGPEPLAVWPSPREWLAADREGVVIVDAAKSLPILYAGSPISVGTKEEQKGLMMQWRPQVPEIVIRK